MEIQTSICGGYNAWNNDRRAHRAIVPQTAAQIPTPLRLWPTSRRWAISSSYYIPFARMQQRVPRRSKTLRTPEFTWFRREFWGDSIRTYWAQG